MLRKKLIMHKFIFLLFLLHIMIHTMENDRADHLRESAVMHDELKTLNLLKNNFAALEKDLQRYCADLKNITQQVAAQNKLYERFEKEQML